MNKLKSLLPSSWLEGEGTGERIKVPWIEVGFYKVLCGMWPIGLYDAENAFLSEDAVITLLSRHVTRV
ncbi:MAG: hypothetical protein COA36_07460 [Desulfotalea sp.]|nr:MAG: hypothetical protein COA36_07460 [Desulfotalea sp.]